MSRYSPCICCGEPGCCTDGAHGDLPPIGTKVTINDVNMVGGGFTDNVWQTMQSWTARSGYSFGWTAFNIIAGGSCEANYSVRLRFTDLCIPESVIDPTDCGVCAEGVESFYNIASGYICAGVTRAIPTGGPFAWSWSCRYRKVELQVRFDWSCSEWSAPGSFHKCTDAQQIIINNQSAGVPSGATPGVYPIATVPIAVAASCSPFDMCAGIDLSFTVTYSGGPLNVGFTRLRTYWRITSVAPVGSTCFAIGNAYVGYGGVPFCEADCAYPQCRQGKMSNWYYNTLYSHYQCRTGDPFAPCAGPYFPTPATLNLQLLMSCCDAAVTMNWDIWYEISKY